MRVKIKYFEGRTIQELENTINDYLKENENLNIISSSLSSKIYKALHYKVYYHAYVTFQEVN